MNASALHESTLRYVGDAAVAQDYDRYFAGQGLFAYDSTLLAQWFHTPGRLIDLGCGTGRHLVDFAARGFDVDGVDLSEAMLAQARSKLTRRRLSGRLIKADFCNLPVENAPSQTAHQTDNVRHIYFARHSFDYALCMFSTLGLVYGAENRLRFLTVVRQLLKETGQFVLHVHNRWYNLFRHEGRCFLLTNLIKRRLGRAEPGDKFLTHYRGIRGMYIHVFTQSEITSLLECAGFDILDVLPLNRRRTGTLRFGRGASLLANGFIIRARPA